MESKYTHIISVLVQLLRIISCQQQYNVQLQKVEQSINNNGFIQWNFELAQYNGSVNIINGEINILQDLPMDLVIHVMGYEKRGNDYYPALIDATFQICEFFKEKHVENIFMLKSNFTRDCPVSMGKYNVYEMIMNSDDIPQKLSSRYWMVELSFLLDANTVGYFRVYARVDMQKKPKSKLSEY